MTLLQKITYLADYIEPWRNKATNLPVIREVAFQDLDKALYMVLHDTLQYLETIHAEIDSTTQQAYEFYRQLQEKTGLSELKLRKEYPHMESRELANRFVKLWLIKKEKILRSLISQKLLYLLITSSSQAAQTEIRSRLWQIM